MNKILEIIKSRLDEFFVFQIEDFSLLIFFKGFKPYSDFKKTSCAISSYYIASNEVYFLSKSLCEKLKEIGIEAKLYKEHNLKKIAYENCGLVKGQNTLLYHPKYGSYFVIGAIKFFADLKTDEKICGTNCNGCKKCIGACPVSALAGGGLNREKCLREIMNGIIEDDLSAKLLKNNILGCEICQRVCPLNEKVEKIAPGKELEDVLDISNLISAAEKGNKSLDSLSKFIGKNYIKKTKILSLAINSAGNSKDKSYLIKVKKFVESQEKAVRINAVRAVNLLEGD